MSVGYQIVVSADAGNADDDAIERARRVLGRAGNVEVVPTSERDDLDRALDATGDRVLVVAGGDGSLHVVINRLWRRGRGAPRAHHRPDPARHRQRLRPRRRSAARPRGRGADVLMIGVANGPSIGGGTALCPPGAAG